VIALVFFVVTRDDVTRTFTIPLRVVQDPNRVLLTKLPGSRHRRAARLVGADEPAARAGAGAAELNLSDARPGPLSVDPASIVMPEGVIFRSMQYEKVDLRFDRVIERPVLVRAELRGAVHPDYEHTRTTIDPPRWRIRGGSGPVNEVQVLLTEPIQLADITADTVVEVPLQRPRQAVEFTATSPGEEPQVKVRSAFARLGERKLSAAVIWPPDQVAPPELPTEVSAIVRGSLPDLRVVDAALAPRWWPCPPREAQRRLPRRQRRVRGAVHPRRAARGPGPPQRRGRARSRRPRGPGSDAAATSTCPVRTCRRGHVPCDPEHVQQAIAGGRPGHPGVVDLAARAHAEEAHAGGLGEALIGEGAVADHHHRRARESHAGEGELDHARRRLHRAELLGDQHEVEAGGREAEGGEALGHAAIVADEAEAHTGGAQPGEQGWTPGCSAQASRRPRSRAGS
jgi:hypothetical protein